MKKISPQIFFIILNENIIFSFEAIISKIMFSWYLRGYFDLFFLLSDERFQGF